MDINHLDEIFSYIDLTANEIQVYMALLQKKKCTPAEVAKISGFRRTKVYELLTSLEKKGACVLLQSNKKIFEPVDPTFLLEKVKKRLSLVTVNISEVSEELSKMYNDPYDANDTVDYVEVLSDQILILKKFNNLVEIAEEEILMSSTGETVTEKLMKKDRELARILDEEYAKLIYKALQKGVLIHGIVNLNDLIKVVVEQEYRQLLEFENYDIRIVENIPCKLALFDGEHIAIGLRGIETGKYGNNTTYIRDKGLGSYLRTSFYSYWEKGISIKEIDIDALVNEGRIKDTAKSIPVK